MMPKQFFYSNCFYYYNKKLLKEWLVLMRLLPHSFNNTSQGTSFKGKVPDIDNIVASKKFTNYALNGLWDNLLSSIKKERPNLIKVQLPNLFDTNKSSTLSILPLKLSFVCKNYIFQPF